MRYALIGEKLSHSYSSDIHSKMGLNYSLLEVARDDLATFLTSNNFDGFNVTIPYKKDVIPYLKNMSEEAKTIGSVNTVKRTDIGLVGFNTDIGGMDYMIKRKGITLTDKNVLILGLGGAGTTAQFYAKKENAKNVFVCRRNGEINYENVYEKCKDVEIIINATPVGMSPNIYGKVIELKSFKKLIAIFDFIYNPIKTELLLEAEKLGIIYSNGLSMLVEQALLAEDIWNDTTHNKSDTERIIKEIEKEKLNIVLYGMASCGKSTLGKIVAKKLNREFVDIDFEIEKKVKKTPSQIIVESGEKVFRDIESSAILDVASHKVGAVISLGGGSVLRSENVDFLKQNGILIYIERDVNLLSAKDRPISQGKGILKLFKERKPLYESIYDVKVTNNGKKEDAVKEIIKGYEDTCIKRT